MPSGLDDPSSALESPSVCVSSGSALGVDASSHKHIRSYTDTALTYVSFQQTSPRSVLHPRHKSREHGMMKSREDGNETRINQKLPIDDRFQQGGGPVTAFSQLNGLQAIVMSYFKAANIMG